jgi:hypothetical protein
MSCCRCLDWLETERNRVAQVALFVAFYEGGRCSPKPIFRPYFRLSFVLENRFYGSKNEQVAQNETF